MESTTSGSPAASPHVTLAPMDEQGVELFERALFSPEGTGEFQWFGFTSATDLRARLAKDGFLSSDGGMLAILLAGSPVGRVEWFARSWGRPATSSCWEIAIGVDAEHRGRGVGSTAQDLLARYLFEHTRRAGPGQHGLRQSRGTPRADEGGLPGRGDRASGAVASGRLA